jgi:putative transposase
VERRPVIGAAAAQHPPNLPGLRSYRENNRRTQAKFLYVDCGYENHADVVGAINILARGHRVLACGEPVQPGRSVKQEPAEGSLNAAHEPVGIPFL